MDELSIILWCTVGVRAAKLRAWYARAPSWRTKSPQGGGSQPWVAVTPSELADANYLVLVDEFAEVTIPVHRTLTRDELRSVCDRYKTKDEIVAALSK